MRIKNFTKNIITLFVSLLFGYILAEGALRVLAEPLNIFPDAVSQDEDLVSEDDHLLHTISPNPDLGYDAVSYTHLTLPTSSWV